MENAALFRMIIERGFNQGDFSVADEVCAAKLIEHEYLAPTDLPGPDILKAQIRQARAEVTNLHLTIEDMVVDGDKVWGRMLGTGIATKSGRNIVMYVFDVCRFENGRLVEHWGVPDRFALLHQAGALPPRPE